MLGAVIGDAAGSPYEFANVKRKDIPLLEDGMIPWSYTDDTIQMVSCADALLRCADDWSDDRFRNCLFERLRYFASFRSKRDYGRGFNRWLEMEEPQPYGSCGNGAAVRAIPIGWFAQSPQEAEAIAEIAASITHNHPEGIKGAKATAAAVWHAANNWMRAEIRNYVEERFYPLDFFLTLDELRLVFRYDDSCQGTVPPALIAFFESSDFEDAIRNAISLGGDSDSLACITGGVAGAYYGVDVPMARKVLGRMDEQLADVIEAFCTRYGGGI